MIEFLHKNWLEIFAVVTGLLYVYLQIRQNKIMWIVGFVSSAIFVYIFFTTKIYAQSAIYGYYVLISVYGFFKWHNNDQKNTKYKVKEIKFDGPQDRFQFHPAKITIMTLINVSILLSVIIALILIRFTGAIIPYKDAFVAGFSIVATWMVTQKIIQHWYFWMGINIFCVYLYASQGLYFTAFMFFVYFIMSIIGLQQWKKDLHQQN